MSPRPPENPYLHPPLHQSPSTSQCSKVGKQCNTKYVSTYILCEAHFTKKSTNLGIPSDNFLPNGLALVGFCQEENTQLIRYQQKILFPFLHLQFLHFAKCQSKSTIPRFCFDARKKFFALMILGKQQCQILVNCATTNATIIFPPVASYSSVRLPPCKNSRHHKD